MSGALFGVVTAGATFGTLASNIPGVGGLLSSVFVRSQRQINSSQGMIIPDCVVEEVGRDDLQITEHPVEQGSVISDHAYKKPREVTLRWSWSNSGNLSNFTETHVTDVYEQLLALQNAREPFTLYTGKSKYTSMLISSLSQTTNAASEYSLLTVMVCREVIIVSTSTTTGTPDQAAQADQSKSSPVQDKGPQTAKPAGSTTPSSSSTPTGQSSGPGAGAAGRAPDTSAVHGDADAITRGMQLGPDGPSNGLYVNQNLPLF